MISQKQQDIIDFIKSNPNLSSKEIYDSIKPKYSYSTLKRELSNLVNDAHIIQNGVGRSTSYQISDNYHLNQPIDMEVYFSKELDERNINNNFKFELIDEILVNNPIFTDSELKLLDNLHNKYQNNISNLSDLQYKKELERLAIDLSWKSSQIEGNTYSLLETELLLKEKQTAAGKTKDEATMLLNHKEAIDFIIDNEDYISPITVSRIEDIHSILMKELDIDRNLRNQRVGITGTNYRPLDNEYQIREALDSVCSLINSKDNVFEKSLLALLLISYIQPFVDGNKRTARIVSNAILLSRGSCPISYRTIDSIDYKKAMLIFYEMNNLYNFKNIYIEQYEFAVNTYF